MKKAADQKDVRAASEAPEQENGQVRPGEPTRICADPRCEHKGEPQPIENFPRNTKAAGGRLNFCRSCWARRISEGRRGKSGQAAPAASRSPAQSDVPAADAGATRRSPLRYESHPSLLIDFSGHEDLLARINQIAAEDLRTPEMQVLYWIRQHNLAA